MRNLIDFKDMTYRTFRDGRAADLDALIAWLSTSCVRDAMPVLEVILSTCISLAELKRREKNADGTEVFAILSSLSDDVLSTTLRSEFEAELQHLAGMVERLGGTATQTSQGAAEKPQPAPPPDPSSYADIPAMSRMLLRARAHADDAFSSVMNDRFVIKTIEEGQCRKQHLVERRRRAKQRRKKQTLSGDRHKTQATVVEEERASPPGRLLAFFTLTCPEVWMRPLGHALEKYRSLVNDYIVETYESVGLVLDGDAKRCHLGSQHDETSIAKTATRGRLAKRFPHVICEYYDFRVQTFLRLVLAHAFDIDDFFTRYEVCNSRFSFVEAVDREPNVVHRAAQFGEVQGMLHTHGLLFGTPFRFCDRADGRVVKESISLNAEETPREGANRGPLFDEKASVRNAVLEYARAILGMTATVDDNAQREEALVNNKSWKFRLAIKDPRAELDTIDKRVEQARVEVQAIEHKLATSKADRDACMKRCLGNLVDIQNDVRRLQARFGVHECTEVYCSTRRVILVLPSYTSQRLRAARRQRPVPLSEAEHQARRRPHRARSARVPARGAAPSAALPQSAFQDLDHRVARQYRHPAHD